MTYFVKGNGTKTEAEKKKAKVKEVKERWRRRSWALKGFWYYCL